MLLMVKNEITGGICHAIHRYTKVNDKYMIKLLIKIRNSHI